LQTTPTKLLDTIGNTPLVALENLFSEVQAKIFAKLEFFNPTGSIKDRIVWHIIQDAEQTGNWNPAALLLKTLLETQVRRLPCLRP